MRIFDLCLSTPWAITTDALEVILAIAARDDVPLRAVEAAKGRPLDNTRSVTYRNSVAIIPIDGSIVRHGDMFSEVSGAVSVDTLARDFTVALNDRSINAILLNIDSPGGEINGIHEFADMIHAARGQKPIEAYVSHLGCSAAYWIASACERIECDATASIGSIGVIAAVPNPSKSRVEFVSSQSPRKRPDVSTERGRADIQDRVDALADVFIDAVARNRGVPRAKVLDDFGHGGVFVGQAAVKAGLVDKIGSFEATLAALAVRAKADAEAPAEDTEEIVGQEEQAQQAPRKGFWAWVKGDAASEFPTEGPPQGDLQASFGQTAARLAKPQEDPRIAELQAQVKAQNERIFSTEASAFVDRLVVAHQAVPSEVAGLRDLYIQAARDDAAAGETTRITRLTAALSAREPVVKASGEKLYVVPNQVTTQGTDHAAELDADEKDAREWATKLNDRNKRAAK